MGVYRNDKKAVKKFNVHFVNQMKVYIKENHFWQHLILRLQEHRVEKIMQVHIYVVGEIEKNHQYHLCRYNIMYASFAGKTFLVDKLVFFSLFCLL